MTNEETITAFMAAGALVAASDGDISIEERQVIALLVEAAELKAGSGGAFQQFNQFAAALRRDPAGAREAIWRAIEPLGAEPGLAIALVKACVKLIRADRDARFEERQVVHELLDRLHLDPRAIA